MARSERLASLPRRPISSDNPGVQDKFGRGPGERLAPVLELVAASPAGDHSAAALAARLGVSVRHLGRLFARHAGVTPARYVELVRVAAAEVLLTATRAPLAEVAAQAGFGSAETMRRAFLRTVGATPGACRHRQGMSRSEGELSLRPGPNQRTLELTTQRDRPAGLLHRS
jgi:transcriptional regulator GlxA family with amidase domain